MGSVGLDEVGRGALAGPVVVAAVFVGAEAEVLRKEVESVLRRSLADSKQLTRKQRERVTLYLEENVAWGIGIVPATVIDREGISQATTLAAGLALDDLRKVVKDRHIAQVIADAGLSHPYERIFPTTRYVRADEDYLEVSLASIVAKVRRDRLMQELDLIYPGYGWGRNVGYGTEEHRRAVQQLGMVSEHRRSFLGKLLG